MRFRLEVVVLSVFLGFSAGEAIKSVYEVDTLNGKQIWNQAGQLETPPDAAASRSVEAPMFICPQPSGFFPISSQACTNHYYGCSDNVAFVVECPNSLLYDPVSHSCSSNVSVSCKNEIFTCPNASGFYPIKGNDCTSVYFVCADYILKEYVCPGGAVFNENACKPVDLVAACPKTTTAPPTTTTESTTTQSTTTTSTTTESTTTTQTTTTTLATTTIGPFKCPPKDGKYPKPDGTCDQYYVCISGVEYLSNCASQGCFDPKYQICTQIPGCGCRTAFKFAA